MAKRVSHSLLDPLLTVPIKSLYPRLRIPPRLPPEAIVGLGHLCAILGAVGFALAGRFAWGGVLGALGVALNHTADVLDGTHARASDQCRNGGELLDHFVDPLSFSYWIAAISYSAGCLLLGLVGVIVLYATAVLTNIKAKMVGEFTLGRFGPTEFKTLLILLGLTMAALNATAEQASPLSAQIAYWFLIVLIAIGVVQLLVNLARAVRDVNASGESPDTTEWE